MTWSADGGTQQLAVDIGDDGWVNINFDGDVKLNMPPKSALVLAKMILHVTSKEYPQLVERILKELDATAPDEKN